MIDVCYDCGGDIETDITGRYNTYSCKKCGLWCQEPTFIKIIMKLNKVKL